MSKKTFMAAIIITAFLFSLVTGIQIVNIVKANPLPPSWMNPHMIITIQSPTNGTNNGLPVFVNFTAQSSDQFYLSTNKSDEWFRSFFYVLDGQSMTSEGIMFAQIQGGSLFTGTDQNFSGQTYLTGLTEGPHTVTVYWGVNTNYPSSPPNENIAYDASWSASTQFYADPQMTPSPTQTTIPTQLVPKISILNPLNDSFFNVSLEGVNYQLTYETNSTLSWVGYSIDGSNNATVTGNSTFVHWFVSSNGYHTLTVYANDTSGNWAIPQSVTYLVNFYQPTIPPDYTPTPPPFPTQQPITSPNATNGPVPNPISPFINLIVFFIIVLAVFIGVLVYFGKRRR